MVQSVQELVQRSGGPSSLLVTPYITKISVDDMTELVIGLRFGDMSKAEIAFGTYMVKRSSPDAELNYGIKVFARTQTAEAEVGGVELQIYDQRQVIVYHWIHPNIANLSQIDINQMARKIHQLVRYLKNPSTSAIIKLEHYIFGLFSLFIQLLQRVKLFKIIS